MLHGHGRSRGKYFGLFSGYISGKSLLLDMFGKRLEEKIGFLSSFSGISVLNFRISVLNFGISLHNFGIFALNPSGGKSFGIFARIFIIYPWVGRGGHNCSTIADK